MGNEKSNSVETAEVKPGCAPATGYVPSTTRLVAGVKVGAPQIIQDREPLVTTELLYAAAA